MKVFMLTILEVIAIIIIPWWIGDIIIQLILGHVNNSISMIGEWAIGALTCILCSAMGSVIYLLTRALWRMNKRICKELEVGNTTRKMKKDF